MDKEKMCPSKSCRRCIYLEKSHVQFGANLMAKFKSKNVYLLYSVNFASINETTLIQIVLFFTMNPILQDQ